MKSQNGIGLVKFVILIIVLILITGVATYVALINNVELDENDDKRIEDTIVNNVKY